MPDTTIYVVDDDDAVRDSLQALLEAQGFRVAAFDSGKSFLEATDISPIGCIISDIRMPGLDGLQMQQELRGRGIALPLLFITGHGDVPIAVAAMKAGAVDFIEKPFEQPTLLSSIGRALQLSRESRHRDGELAEARRRMEELTNREREVMVYLAQGKQNKMIAIELGISPRTVEIHRARVLDKMAARSLSDLVRITLGLGLI